MIFSISSFKLMVSPSQRSREPSAGSGLTGIFVRVAPGGTLAERPSTGSGRTELDCFASLAMTTPPHPALLYMEGDFMNARGEKHSGRDRSTPSGSTKTVREHGSSRPSTQTRTVAWATRAVRFAAGGDSRRSSHWWGLNRVERV